MSKPKAYEVRMHSIASIGGNIWSLMVLRSAVYTLNSKRQKW
ncbi:hypothetical protein [Desulfosporosinus nitroreducens]|nr:hypothetical protein [Desulfosporosinus nitroreducens]